MKIRIYARESSDDTNRAPPIGNQIAACREEIVHSQELFAGELKEPYVDDGWSGGAWNRPAFNQMLNDAKRHDFNVLVVWDRDRLARDTEQFLRLCRSLKEAGVKIWRLDKHRFMDLDTADERLTETIGAATDEYYRTKISEKTRRAFAFRKKKADELGVKIVWGRKPIPPELIAKAQELRDYGLSCRTIAAQLPPYITLSKKGARKEHRVSPSWVHYTTSKNRGEKTAPPATSEPPIAIAPNNNRTILEQEEVKK